MVERRAALARIRRSRPRRRRAVVERRPRRRRAARVVPRRRRMTIPKPGERFGNFDVIATLQQTPAATLVVAKPIRGGDVVELLVVDELLDKVDEALFIVD